MKLLANGWTEAPIRTLMQPLPDGKLVHQGWSPQCESGPASSDSDWGALKTTAIQDGAYLPEHNKRLPDSLEAKERLEVLPGDLLMTCAGPRVRCGVACLVRVTPPRRFISGKMYRFRSNEALIDPRLLEAFLRTPATKAQIDAMKTGISESGMNITHEKFSQLVVPVAPRPEQKRIADKLDTVLARVDAVNTRLARVAPLLKRFRQSVLAAATSGRMPLDQEGENRYADWPNVQLGGICSKVTDGEHATPKRATSGKYLLSARNVRDGSIALENVDFVDQTEFDRLRLRCDPSIGDVLLSCSGSVGRVALVDRDDAYVMVRSAALIRPDREKLIPKFLMYALQSPQLQQQILEASRSTAQANIFLGPIKQLTIALPSLVEQAEIVSRIETLFAFADRLEARLQAAQTAADRLTPSLLAKAFRGELVPQDPNDEPASELLMRLAKQEPTSNTKRLGRKVKST